MKSSQNWWYTAIILKFRRIKEKDLCKLETSLYYPDQPRNSMTPSQNKTQKQEKRKDCGPKMMKSRLHPLLYMEVFPHDPHPSVLTDTGQLPRATKHAIPSGLYSAASPQTSLSLKSILGSRTLTSLILSLTYDMFYSLSF